jgi:hypothetical protein
LKAGDRFLLVNHNSTMNTNMTYTTELERKRTILIGFTKEIEKDYNGLTTKVLRSIYKEMYEFIKDVPVGERMNVIDNIAFQAKMPTTAPIGESEKEFLSNIIGALMTAIFTFTHLNLKEDLLEAMKSIE